MMSVFKPLPSYGQSNDSGKNIVGNWLWIAGLYLFVVAGCSLGVSTLLDNTNASPLPSTETPSFMATTQPPSAIHPTANVLVEPPIPTFSADETWMRINELLTNNGHCRLPCFWGIAPGDATGADAQALLRPFTGVAKRYTFSDERVSMSWIQERENLQMYITAAYRLDVNGMVKRVYFHATAIEFFGMDGERNRATYANPIFNQQFREYMLPQILTNYGPPAEVYVLTYSGSAVPALAQPSFYLLLMYPEQGIFIDYTAPWKRDGEYVLGCPANAHMNLWLLPPGTENYAELLGGRWGTFFENATYYKTVEEATSMTIEEFYQAFKDADSADCLRTPAELWPEIVQ